jgi:hypothetical protein
MQAPSGFAIFHLFLTRAAKARPGNSFQTLDFDGIFTTGTDAIVVTFDALNRVLNRTLLVEFSAFEHEGDFAIACATGNVERIAARNVVTALQRRLLGNLGENNQAAFLEIGPYRFKFFSHEMAVLC